MKRLFLLLFIIAYFESSAQKSDSLKISTNCISVELAGAGIAYSINYDKVIVTNLKSINFTLGLGTRYNSGTYFRTLYIIPKASLLLGNGPFYFGLGLTWIRDQTWEASRPPGYWVDNPDDYLFPHIFIQYQAKNNGLFASLKGYLIKNTSSYNINSSYLYDLDEFTNDRYNFQSKEKNILWPGLSLGYTFSIPKRHKK